MSAPRTDRFGPIDPYKYPRKSGRQTSDIVSAVMALQRGDPDEALRVLLNNIADVDPDWSEFCAEQAQRWAA